MPGPEKNETPPVSPLEIAVIGMAGRFPGAKDIDQFQENLKNGIEAIAFFSAEELEAAGIARDLTRNPDYVKARAMLAEVEFFDPFFFQYSKGEAELMDPQIRLFHECAWNALEDSGYDPGAYEELIGLYAGASPNFNWEAAAVLSGKVAIFGAYAAGQLTGKDMMCLRVAHKLNLRGPVFSLYTACSTSLLAIHLACQGLLDGECDMALAGGAAIALPQTSGYLYQEGMIASADGHCKAFDAEANGTITGSGLGLVVLKRLEDALRDNDYVHAVIKGSASNNDGDRKVGFTAPSVKGQVEAIRTAHKVAAVEPESISYLETHGTGTPLGDPIELKALAAAFNFDTKKYCAIGSVKTNIGHLDVAAGVAGFIKTVLALKYRQLPPSLHFKKPNPKLDIENSPFYVVSQLKEWKNNEYPLRAGVSSLGIGGTNVHVVLEEWPGNNPQANGDRTQPTGEREYRLILLSAKTGPALERASANLVRHLGKDPGINLADAAYTLKVGRKRFQHRRMAVCPGTDLGEAVKTLEAPGDKDTIFSKEENRPVIFMFPGQGAQYVDMGKDLYRTEPAFTEEMDRCFEILKHLVDYDSKEILYPSAMSNRNNRSYMSYKSNINRTEITQPLLFIFEYALAKLLMKWGIKPYSMIGHSIGEYTAACLAGVFSLEDALKMVVLRGKLMQQMPEGAMLAVSLSREELQPRLSLNKEISIAAVNSPCLCVVSGPHQAIGTFARQLNQKGYKNKPLHTSHAFHSKMMDPVLEAFREQISREKIRFNPAKIPYISNLSGEIITVREAASPAYWVTHLRETVKFSQGINELLKTPEPLFLEVGPGRTLSTSVKQHKQQNKAGPNPLAVNLVRHPKEEIPDACYLLGKLGRLWLYGVKINWREFYSRERRHRIPLPGYSFDRIYCWLDGNPGQANNNLKRLIGKPRLSQRQNNHPQEEEKCGPPGESEQRRGLTTHYKAPTNTTEQILAGTWKALFGIDNPGIDDDFFELGGDSLQAMTITNNIHKITNVKIPLEVFFSNPSIKKLARYIADHEQNEDFSPVEAAEKKEYYQLSPAQRRLLFLHNMETGSVSYNLANTRMLKGKIPLKFLDEIFKKLIRRHDVFRTSFELIQGNFVQRVHPGVEFETRYYEKEKNEIHGTVTDFVKPFELDKAPLLRVGMIKPIDHTGHTFIMVDMHHIISDGMSMAILIKELSALVKDEELTPLRIQYKDYTQWYNKKLHSGWIKKQEEYWVKQFEADVPRLNLPMDFARPALRSVEGGTVGFETREEETARLKALTLKENTTLFILLLSVFYIFLAKLTGQEDITVAAIHNGRQHSDLDQVVGMFVNTLLLRNFPAKAKGFKDFLKEVKTNVLGAFANKDYQLDELIDKLVNHRDPGRHPITDVGFMFQNLEGMDLPAGNLPLSAPNPGGNEVMADFACIVIQAGKTLAINFQYCSKLFKKETLHRYVNYFKDILTMVVENNRLRLEDIKLKHELLSADSTMPEIGFTL